MSCDSLSVVIPMWNEESNIRSCVREISWVCEEMIAQRTLSDYEVLIVNDASTDATGAIADELAASSYRVRVVHHPVNRKLGGSLQTGFTHARKSLILYMDADLPCDPGEIRRALRLMKLYQADLVSGYRLDRVCEGAKRAVYSFFYNLLIRVLFGVRLRDINFAFKLFRRRVLQYVELRSEGSFIDAELMIRSHHAGFRTIQFGVDYFPRFRGESTLSSLGVIFTMLKEILQLGPALKGVPRAVLPRLELDVPHEERAVGLLPERPVK